MATIKFKLKKSLKEDGMASVYLQVIHHRRVKKIFTKQYVFAYEWSKEKEWINYESKVNDRKRLAELRAIEIYLERCRSEVELCIMILSGDGVFSNDYDVEDVVRLYWNRASNSMLKSYIEYRCRELKKQKRHRTAEAYLSTLNSLLKFNEGKDVPLTRLNAAFLKSYEIYLRRHGCQPNTISFYMRMLRSIFNQAVADRLIDNRSQSPFRQVFTGVEKTRKRAVLSSVLKRLKQADLSADPSLEQARDFFLFSFYTRGMSWVDMVFLLKENIQEDVLHYRRSKCGQEMSIRITKPLAALIKKYSKATEGEPYVLPVISSKLPDKRLQYKNSLHNQNRRLKRISEQLEIYPCLTTYSSRHSWATIAKEKGVHISVISEGMGHHSERTTEIYLASFEASVLDKANEKIISL